MSFTDSGGEGRLAPADHVIVAKGTTGEVGDGADEHHHQRSLGLG